MHVWQHRGLVNLMDFFWFSNFFLPRMITFVGGMYKVPYYNCWAHSRAGITKPAPVGFLRKILARKTGQFNRWSAVLGTVRERLTGRSCYRCRRFSRNSERLPNLLEGTEGVLIMTKCLMIK
jgi:hypothetical protein